MKTSKAAPPPELDHEAFLRRSFDIAKRAREGGDHPFGSLLVGPDGAVLHEQGNGFSAEGGDMTAHAERLLATWASKTYGADFLAGCTLYSSAEPCAMCSGAIYWAGIGRLVYGQSEKDLKAATGAHAGEPDARPALPRRLRRRSAEGRDRRPAARRGIGGVAARFLERASENVGAAVGRARVPSPRPRGEG